MTDWKHCDGCVNLKSCEEHGCLKEAKVELEDCDGDTSVCSEEKP